MSNRKGPWSDASISISFEGELSLRAQLDAALRRAEEAEARISGDVLCAHGQLGCETCENNWSKKRRELETEMAQVREALAVVDDQRKSAGEAIVRMAAQLAAAQADLQTANSLRRTAMAEVERLKHDLNEWERGDVGEANRLMARRCVDAEHLTRTAQAEVVELRRQLERIANHPHCSYDSYEGHAAHLDRQYEIGASDGHRCAAEIARAALEPK